MTKTVTQKNTPMKPAKMGMRGLDEVVKAPQLNSELMGVILDCTGSYKTNNSYDYLLKVKIIDRSHNPTAKPFGGAEKLSGFITAYIFAESVKGIPAITKVGDVLFLSGANCDTYRGQVKCKLPKRKGNWAVFDGRVNAPKAALCACTNFPGLERSQQEHLTYLRDWSLHFFLNNSLLNLGWYACVWPRAMIHDKTYQLKDVDLLVKVLGSSQAIVEGKRYQKLAFGDVDRNFYFSELCGSHISLETDMMAKLRSVCLIRTGTSIRIDFYQYSSVLLLPEQSRDARNLASALAEVKFDVGEIEAQFFEELHLEKYHKHALSHNIFVYDLSEETGPDLTPLFQILESFSYVPSAKPMSAFIKKIHLATPVTQLSELTEVMKGRKPGMAWSWQTHYRVQARIVRASHTSLREIAHFYSPSANKAWPLDSLPSSIKLTDLKVIFHVVLQLQDSSTGANAVSCHLFTFDDNPVYFFDLWRLLPDVYSVESWKNLQPALASEFSSHFKNFVKKSKQGEFVVELQKNDEGKVYVRIIDTILSFYV